MFTIFDTLQSWLDITSGLDFIFKALLIYAAVFWLALIVWVTRDVINRSNSIIFQTFTILLNTFLPVFGLIIYLLVRPSKTLLDSYYDELELKALNIGKYCEKCSTPLNDTYDYCPECGMSLKKECASCKKQYFKTYKICPFCGEKEKKEKVAKSK